MQPVDLLIADKLLKIGAFKIQPDAPFMWGNGWSAPIYSDNRLALSFPVIRNYIKLEMARAIATAFDNIEVIAGVATGAIAIGAITADALGLPYVYVRETPKDHGLENRIEGNIVPGQRVVIIEDLLITGKACLSAHEALTLAGADVVGVVALFNYEFPTAVRALSRAKLPFVSITGYKAMLKAALAGGLITQDDVPLLNKWHTAPLKWVPTGLDVEL